MKPSGSLPGGHRNVALRIAWIAVASVFCSSSIAQTLTWTVGSSPPPLHPSVIMVNYNGKSYPVTAVAGEVPEIEVDGKLVRLHSSQTYEPRLAGGYGRGSLQFKAQSSSSQVTTMSYRMQGTNGVSIIPGGTISTSGEYKCTIVSTEPQSGCYIAIVFFRQDAQGVPDTHSIAIAFENVGNLAAGRETAVKVDCAYVMPGGGKYYFFPMAFSKGVEIRSDQSEIEAQFFHHQETAAHAVLLAHYRQKFQNADHKVVAYLRFPPLLPEDVDPHTLPPVIEATFAVVETGEVDSLEIKQTLDPRVENAIRRALNGWLFLPQLRKGIPVRTMIDLPLSFGASS